MNKTAVLICDAEYLSRTGLKYIVDKNPFFEVKGEAVNQEQLETLISSNNFDIVTLDVSPSGAFGFESISLVQEISPETEILVVSNEDDKRNIYDILARGINRYLTKCCKDAEIYNALEACKKREKYYCPKILDVIIDKTFRDQNPQSEPSELTQREKEVVTYIAQGKVAKEISAKLNISIHTIYTHRKNIMKKLDISSPVELVTYAINNGLVEA